ncbi:MAG: HAD-IC family P-type ATPase, partial [Oscillospiraceae bacterium]|nr:HAD-IC family P-type ATPase [Oscillospiraceae bacterium]
MKYPREALENIYRQLQTCPDKGLSAGRAAELQNEIGFNKFDEEKKETVWRKVWHHLKDFSSLILIVAAGISLVLAIMEDHGFAEPIVILSIVVINIILAVRQEMDAERALEALKNMHARMTVVIRDGVRQPLDAVQLVPGDILMLETGDMIPADARIIECVNLKVEESALTGESVSVEKDAGAAVGEKVPIGDQVNMLFSGCLITNGRAKAVVVETGMRTEMGKIAGLLNDTKKVRTPLQKRLVRLGKVLTVVALASAAVLFTLEFLHGQKLLDILMNAVALAVAAVPETLMVIATITLAYGVRVMARKKAIIRKIAAVEALGCATVICSDKTGTLTQNRMCIQRVWAVSHPPKNAGEEFNHDERMLIEMMGLASNASINIHTGAEIGDPTETAIVRLLRDKRIEKESLDAIFPKVFEIPFDSGRKLMTTVHELEDMRYLSITKGAFDRIPV